MPKLILILLLLFNSSCIAQKLALSTGFLYPHFYWDKKDQRIRNVNYGQSGIEINANTHVKNVILTIGYRNIKQNLTETVDHEPPNWAVYKYKFSRNLNCVFIGLETELLKINKWSALYQTGISAYKTRQTHFIGATTQSQFIDTIIKTRNYNISWGQFQKVKIQYNLSKKITFGFSGMIEFRVNPFLDLPKYYYIKQDAKMMHCFAINIDYNLIK